MVAFRMLAAAAGLAMLSACASGPKFADIKASLPPLAGDAGRIYFYRSGSPFGAAIQPDVLLNGQRVGSAQPGGFFFVDRAPGNFEVSLTTEVEKKLTFALDRGQLRYVRMSVGLGLVIYRVYPELVEPREAEPELQQSSYTGILNTRAVQPAALQPAEKSGADRTGGSVPAGAALAELPAVANSASGPTVKPVSIDDLKDLLPAN